MPKRSPLWSSYDVLRKEYISRLDKNFGTEFDPKAAFKLNQDENKIPEPPAPMSEHATFMYGVNKIKSLIEEEIKILNGSSKQKICERFEQDCLQLIKNFEGEVSTMLIEQTRDRDKFNKIGTDFLADAAEMIKKYEPQIESNESWAPFLKNVGLLLSVIGTLPALFSMANKAVTGKYTFFDEAKIDDNQLQQPLPSTTPKLK